MVSRAKSKSANGLEPNHLVIKGAREHNLQIDHLKLPKRRFIVFTGVSGSGKSSLAFDTIFAEGQRRYVESLSAYARQFLGQMDKPLFDHISGLSPTIAIEQKAASGNPRSTVGTITEIADYLRVLYARVGVQHCHRCGEPVAAMSPDEIVKLVRRDYRDRKVLLLAPILIERKGEHRELLSEALGRGFVRARIDGKIQRLDALTPLDAKRKHSIELVVDRLTVKAKATRLTDSVETALTEGEGTVIVAPVEGDEPERHLSEHRFCVDCGIAFPELSPQSFSFNTPLGMCTECNGLGRRLQIDPDLVVPDTSLSIREGAIAPFASIMERESGWTFQIVEAMVQHYDIDLDKPWKRLSARHRRLMLYGSGDERVRVAFAHSHGQIDWNMHYEGIVNTLMRRYQQTQSEAMRRHYLGYFAEGSCDSCHGSRLRAESRAVRVADVTLDVLSGMTIAQATEHFASLKVPGSRAQVARELVKELSSRLGFLMDVGLDYLTLDRSGPTLSAGEAQRLRLASQLGAELSGVLYVLDEPTIGLHLRDCNRLVDALVRLRDLGNTVIAVEHDRATIDRADHVVDFGPGAGSKGGQVVFQGSVKACLRSTKSLTGRYLSGRERIEVPPRRHAPEGFIKVHGAARNNLQNIDVSLPLGVMCVVTGVSGAGKSSLVNSILYPALRRHLHGAREPVVGYKRITGLAGLDKVIRIDQQPIGRTPRSNPATYTKAFDHIRKLFAQTPESRTFGFAPGRFSFNVRGGRCEACEGAGVVKVEMHFLADMYVPCQVCAGKRFNDATLRVQYKDHNIYQILESSVAESLDLFANHRGLSRILQTLNDVGLEYIRLGQPATTLSGGEAQRVKLSRELAKRSTGSTLYLLDEPTSGLHFDDIRKLLAVLDRLVEAGNTVVVIEHNLDVIKCADYIVDLGPEGGAGGGTVVAAGTPEEVAQVRGSYTGQALAKELGGSRRRRRKKKA
jgi:excinuclease ABC subunit A